jgi:hypothetical protein
MLVVFAPKLTFGELMAEPTTAPIIAGLRAVRDNEPTERWHRHMDAAVALLKDASLADVPVQIAAEVQATFDAFGAAREQMHSAYVLFLCRRSDLVSVGFGWRYGGGGSTRAAYCRAREHL